MDESRREIKQRMARTLETAEVSPKAMTALYLGCSAALGLIMEVAGTGVLSLFLPLLTWLLSIVLGAGFVLYCMTIRQGQRAEYLTLFDGFDISLKIALLAIVKGLFIFLWYLLFLLLGVVLAIGFARIPVAAGIFLALWSMLCLIPAVIAAYRYSFALYNLLENPDIGVMQAISMSKRQTFGWKGRLFVLYLSYFPWYLLASIPTLVYNFLFQAEVISRIGGISAYDAEDFLQRFTDTMSAMNGAVLGIPSLGWSVIIGLWTLAVAVFYLPHYQCTALEYFEKAKRESGIGEGAAPWDQEEFYQQ